MENLFSALNHTDSIAFMISVLVSFLIGFITSWILWGGRASRYRKEAMRWKHDFENIQTTYASLREEIDLKEADILRVQREAEKSLEYARSVDARKAQWISEIEEVKDDKQKFQEIARSYAATIDDLNHQILGLKSRLNQQSSGTGNSGFSASNEKNVQHASAERASTLEKRLIALDGENQALRAELSSLKNMKVPEFSPAKITPPPHVESLASNTAIVAKSEDIGEAIERSLPKASKEVKDDLTMIKGIGPVLESKLNDLGIYTYKQISAFDEALAGKVNEAIEFFPGRILRDDWVGQAARLAQLKEENPAALDPTAIFPKNPQDLKIVEGIGPKIEKLLKKAGLNTLQELSEANEQTLKDILTNAGDAYRIHDPSTWPTQASLAASGDWEKLKEYQDLLLGGRDVG